MKYEVTARRLREALNDAGMIPQELSDRSKVGKSSVSHYINGSHKPSNITAGKLAGVLNVSPMWLMGFDVPKIPDADKFKAYADRFNEAHKGLPTVKERTLLNNYGKLSEADKEFVDSLIERLLHGSPATETPTKTYPYFHHIAAAGKGFLFSDIPTDTITVPVKENADFIIGVSGDSMEPTYSDGDDVYVSKSDTVNVGDVAIFTLHGQCYIKELGKSGLISHNHQYNDIPGSSDIRCIGKVLGKVVM